MSPSDENVSAFLVSVSHLSKERTLEERQRQRDLQRDIDELKRRLKNIPPPKPYRDGPHTVTTTAVVDLAEPVARKTPPKPRKSPKVLPSDPVLVQVTETIDIIKGPTSGNDRTYRSFSQIEAEIRYQNEPEAETETTNENDHIEDTEPRNGASELKSTSKPLKPVNKPLPMSREERLAKHFAESQNKVVIPMPKASYVPKGGYLNLNDKKLAPPKSSKPRKLLGSGQSGNFPVSTFTQNSPPRAKSSWLTSSLANNKTSVTHQNLSSSPPPKLPRRQNDWISSSLSNPASKSPTAPSKPSKSPFVSNNTDPSLTQLSPQGSPKSGSQTSWINSAVNKAQVHQFDDKAKPVFLIPKSISVKSKLLLEKDQKKKEKEPEFVNMLHTLKKRTTLPPPRTAASVKSQEELDEYADKIESMRKSPTRTVIPEVTEEIPEGLRPRLSPTRKGPPSKPSKRPVSEFSKNEEEMLTSALSNLSKKNGEKSKHEMSSFERYKAQDTELLKLQMLKLGKKTIENDLGAKPKEEIEGLSALNKLKPTKKPPKLEQEVPEALRKLEIMKPTNKQSPAKQNIPDSAIATKPGNFQDHLALILRTGSTSSFGGIDSKPETVPLRRIQSDVPETKLTHPNKGRSRGPKRRLPKNMASSGSSSVVISEPTPEIAKRVPPPKREKPKSVGPLTPTRKFEGDLFI